MIVKQRTCLQARMNKGRFRIVRLNLYHQTQCHSPLDCCCKDFHLRTKASRRSTQWAEARQPRIQSPSTSISSRECCRSSPRRTHRRSRTVCSPPACRSAGHPARFHINAGFFPLLLVLPLVRALRNSHVCQLRRFLLSPVACISGNSSFPAKTMSKLRFPFYSY